MSVFSFFPLMVAILFLQGCITKTPDSLSADYNAKEMMQKWRNQGHYPYYSGDQDNPSGVLPVNPGKMQTVYPRYVAEDDNPESYYYLVPVPRTSSTKKPPADGFNAPIFKKQHSADR